MRVSPDSPPPPARPAPGAGAVQAPVWRQPEFAEGARDMVSIAIGIAAWGLVTGVAMANSGMGIPLALAMSLLVFAGSAQLATMPLIAAGAPLWVIWATALCVNLRFVIFSAGWRPYLIDRPLGERLRLAYYTADLNYVLFMRRYPEPRPEPGQLAYFWGGVVVNASSWHVASLIGIALSQQVPAHWGVGFAGTLALISLTCSLLTTRVTWVAAAVAACAAIAAYALPLRLNILVAIAAAVAAGLLLDAARGGPPSKGGPAGSLREDAAPGAAVEPAR